MPIQNTPWDNIFRQRVNQRIAPYSDLPNLVQWFQQGQVKRVLDLGCGSGQNLSHLAEEGFKMYGLDNSLWGLKLAQQNLNQLNLKAALSLHNMLHLWPYPKHFFDGLLAIDVLHYATPNQIHHLTSEITRVLKPGGHLFVSVASHKESRTTYKKIDEATFLRLSGPLWGVAHHCFTPASLQANFAEFVLVTDVYQDDEKQYCLQAVKKLL